MNERLQQFLAAENISQSQFAETIGVARASVSHILAGRNRPGYDFICSLLEHYPSLNSEWILMGKGKMYKGAVDKAPQADAPVIAPVPAPLEAHKDENGTMVQESLFTAQEEPEIHASAPVPPVSSARTVSKIIVFYSDNTFQELKG